MPVVPTLSPATAKALQDDLFVLSLCLEMMRKQPAELASWLSKFEATLSHCAISASVARSEVERPPESVRH